MPDHLSVGGVKKGDPIPIPIPETLEDPSGVPLGLFQNIVGTDADLLGLYNPEQPALYEKGIIGRAVGSGEFFNGAPVAGF